MSKQHPPKPKYRVDQIVVGRTNHLGKNLPNETVMVKIESARYESKYGHWVYCGTVEHEGEFGTVIEIYEWDVIHRWKK